jgi:hypothetical protein
LIHEPSAMWRVVLFLLALLIVRAARSGAAGGTG